jgi:hypothetical protein
VSQSRSQPKVKAKASLEIEFELKEFFRKETIAKKERNTFPELKRSFGYV